MKQRKRLDAIAAVALACLGAGVWALADNANAQIAPQGRVAPIPPEDARAIENLIDDQGEMRFVITYPAHAGAPASHSSFVRVEDRAAVNGTACTIVTRVVRQRDQMPAASYRSVSALGDVGHMQIMTLSALSSMSWRRSPAENVPQNSVDPEIMVVVLSDRNDPQRGIFMFRSMEPARRFLAILQRVVPRCGGRDD